MEDAKRQVQRMQPRAVCHHQDGEWEAKGVQCGKFELPEVAERACWMMNGMKLSGRKTDVQINRNA